MAKDPAFLFYSSDFLTGTMFMSNEQVGIYIRLLCAQHQHGGLIDKVSFNSLVNGHDVIKIKFIETDDGFFNERLMNEIDKRTLKSSNLSANAVKRWENHNQKKSESNAIALHRYMPCEDENENEIKNKDIKEKIIIYDFDSVWLKYPKHIGKKDAERHFRASVKTDQDFKDIQTALSNFLSSRQGKGDPTYIPHGSTWFNNWRDWVDMPETEKVCQKCRGKGKFISKTGYEIICDCPAGQNR